MRYAKGLQEVGDGFFAYLQPDGGWGWSNAGLVVDGERTLLIDTLFDLRLTEEMLRTMRGAVPAAARIDTLVNTHANGDHCYGNQLVGDAVIVASQRTAEEMTELPPEAMAELVAQAPEMGELGEFFLRCFGAFDFDGIQLALPHETFSGERSLAVGRPHADAAGGRPCAHARRHAGARADRGCAVHRRHPLRGRSSDRLGGPGVQLDRSVRAHHRLETERDRARARPAERACGGERAEGLLRVSLRAGASQPWQWHDAAAGSAIAEPRPLGRLGRERAPVVNLANIYAELDGEDEPLNPLAAFQQMAELSVAG